MPWNPSDIRQMQRPCCRNLMKRSEVATGHSFLIFDIRPIDVETKFHISCLNRPSFKLDIKRC